MSRYNLYINRRGTVEKREYFNDRATAWAWADTYRGSDKDTVSTMYDTVENTWYVPGISHYALVTPKRHMYTLKPAQETDVDPLIRAYVLLN